MARSKKKRRGKGGSSLILVLLAGLVVGILCLAALVKITETSLPPVPTWDEYAASVPKVTRILAADGSVIRELYTERRTLITPDGIPPLLMNAVLATEDSDFMNHGGLSYVGIARAMLSNLVAGRVSQGGSTISQQVVKQLLLTPERTLTRKFKELLLTRQLEMKLTKKEILAIYFSQTYLGHGRYGFEEAARFYFGKGASKLRVEEAAVLAGLVSSPEGNSILKNPDGAGVRQMHVLKRMAELGMITAGQADVAADAVLDIVGRDDRTLGAAPYFADAVVRELTKLVGAGQLEKGGLTVQTSVDLKVSSAAGEAVRVGLANLYRSGRVRFEDEFGPAVGVEDNGLEEESRARSPSALGKLAGCRRAEDHAFIAVGDQMKVVDNSSIMRLGETVDERLNALCGQSGNVVITEGVGKVRTSDGMMDEVNVELGPQASFVVLDSRTRAVMAMIGGENFESRPYNRAIQASMPIGSTIKPFIYAAALMAGIPEDEGWVNEPVSFRGFRGRMWTPRNYGGSYDGRTYDMAGALKGSINVIAVKVLKETGVEKVASLLESAGFSGHIPRDLSMALGSVEASPLELANAYAVFGSGGNMDTPWMIKSVTDYRGVAVFSHESRPGRVVPAGASSRIKSMMRQVVLDGTAHELASIDADLWGKTGTTNKSREAWFAGGFGNLTGAVLIAYDDRLPMKGATGGNTAVPFFKLFAMNYLGHREAAAARH